MRIVVVGTSGSGKSTMAKALANALGVPHVEMDAINWQAGWRDLAVHEPEEFFRRVADAAAGEAWVIDGNYTKVRAALWPRATAFVWMDPERWPVMRQVLWRSFRRAVTKTELWPGTGNTEQFRRWLDPGHPIRWAWTHWPTNRARYGAAFADGTFEGRPVYRVGDRQEGRELISRLAAEARTP
jgi:energy-coupling factor transporter ATP-binding protein EcfA2